MSTQAAIKPDKRQLKAHHYSLQLMACGFVLTAVDKSPQKAWDAIRAAEKEIVRIENVISSWKSDSETGQINQCAGIRPVRVSTELFQLIQRSIKISEITAGAFDISGTLARYYWNFNRQENAFLPPAKIHKLRDLINYRLIELNPDKQTIFLKKKGMKIGFGGIGKGYAAQRAAHIMQQMGIQSGLINASGDLMCWGQPPNQKQWPIHIPNPQNRTESLLEFSIPYGSVVTSGNFENYTLIDGKRYSHIVDPRTGLPVQGIQNVSVVCPNPEFADAMATAISVMGLDTGLQLVNRLNGVDCIIIDASNKVHYSEGLAF